MNDATGNLQKKIIELEEALALQQEFISMITHQLKTPLTASKWTYQMLKDGDLAEFSPEQLTIINEGYKSNQRMLLMLDELSRANKTGSWQFSYTMEPLDVEELTEHVITEFLNAAHAHRIALRFKRTGKPVMVVGDYEKVKIVIEHMVENAIKYAPNGTPCQVSLDVSDPAFAHLSVHNHGTTVNPRDLVTIFDKYTRGTGAKASGIGGTGMGLFTAKRITEDHGGELSFKSNADEGTTVALSLPIA